MDKELIELTNPTFVFKFAGRDWNIRKANLTKAISYQQKVKELTDNRTAALDLHLVSFCIWLSLKDVDPQITEEWVRDNTPGDVDVVDTLVRLGFMSPKQKEMVQTLQNQSLKT